MCKKCILCNNIHGEIYQRFDRFFETEKIDETQIHEFIRFIEFELKEKNWNEVYCLIDNMGNSMKLKNNLSFNEIQFQNTIHEIKKLCSTNPTLISFTELKESLSNNFLKLNTDLGSGIKKNIHIDYKKEFGVLLDSLEKIKEFESGTNASLITPLKNYIVFRTMSFFEQRIYDILVTTINDLDSDILYDIQGSTMTLSTSDIIDSQSASIGNLAVLGLNNNTRKIDSIIHKILQNKIKTQRSIKLKNYSSFFDYFGNIIRINDPKLSKYFSETSQGKWSKFIKNLNNARNQMTHELTNPKYNTNELENEIHLMYILLRSFPHILEFVLNYFSEIKNKDKVVEIHKDSKGILEEAECEILPYKECIEEIKFNFMKPGR
jgi:hypothetical protein